jgi:hypothetical protein
VSYQKARAKMIGREADLRQRLRNRFRNCISDRLGFGMPMSEDEFFNMIEDAGRNVWYYASAKLGRQHMDDLERIRERWADGMESKGKTFRNRLTTILFMEKAVYMMPRDNPQEVFDLLRGCSAHNKPMLHQVAYAWDWLPKTEKPRPEPRTDPHRKTSSSRTSGTTPDFEKGKFRESWDRANDPIFQATQMLLRREKTLVQSLLHKLNSAGASNDLSPTEVHTAAANAKKYAASLGYNGWLYRTERLRTSVASGIDIGKLNADKEFVSALYRCVSLECVLRFLETEGTWVVVSAVKGAAAGASEHDIERYAAVCGFLRHYPPEPRSRPEPGQTYRDRSRESWDRPRSGETFEDWFKRNFFGGSAAPEPHVFRENEWAYSRESAIPREMTWYQILEVEASADATRIKNQYRLLSKQFHPDICKDAGAQDKFMAVAAAYRVAMKILEEGRR